MSAKNVETVRRGIEAFNRHDAEAAQALCTQDFELLPMRAALEGTAYRGPAAWAQAFEAFDESWAALHYAVEEIQPNGDRVVVVARLQGEGRQSGAAIDQSLALLFTFRDDKLASVRAYPDPADALEAAGLPE